MDTDWLFQGILDAEQKEYILLSYFQKINQNLEELKIYPMFTDLSLHLGNIQTLLTKNQILYTNKNFYNKGSAEELICYAYLKAMDNYFDVKTASMFSAQASKLNPKSYTISIINQLIKVQMIGSPKQWCEVYSRMDNVRENTDLVLDFRKEASEIIFKYTDGYKEYCTFWNAIRNFF